ncbi:PIG-L family deacetylase [Strepomyces sp. STD 3.1]|uniref:PIG-L deacetylase family protein n=1 Tax=Streptomyces sp. NPDC058985 TaxID=3346684 RepID=UPI001F3C40AE|nr:PIG-L family deacetylase [Streptomyces sp. STD 3.1]
MADREDADRGVEPAVGEGGTGPDRAGELRGVSVLVADRDPGVAARISTLLGEHGAHPVGQAGDEDGFLEAIRSRPDAWHVVLWDEAVEPDPRRVTALLETWHREFPATAVVLTTDTLSADVALRALRAGAADLMSRDAPSDEVVATVRRAHDAYLARRPSAQVAEPPRMLVVGAHPDDCEIGAGGTIHRRIRDGWQVSLLAMSHGSWGGEPDQRAQEAYAGASALGASFHLADFPDGHITDETETVQAIERVVREVDPDVVLVHSAHDTHQDHRAVHRATLVAARRVPRISCYQSPSATTAFTPNRFIGLREDDVEAKLASIARHASQATTRPYLDVGLIRATARYWGRFTNDMFAEPLEVVRYTAGIERSLV